MLRRVPARSIFHRSAKGLKRRLVNWLDGSSFEVVGQPLMPARYRRAALPMIHSLEPRFVLNATAELNAFGQLVVIGSDAAETVELQVESDGKLRLRDGAGDVIEINGHPDGVIGATNSLDPAAITSHEIRFDTRGGDDILLLQLPSRIDITVAASDGNDTTTVRGTPPANVRTGSLSIDSEVINVDTAVRTLNFDGAVHLIGDVSVGAANEVTQLNLGHGGLRVDGRLIVAGDVRLVSEVAPMTSSPIDLSAAIVSANSVSSNLSIDASVSEFLLGGADDSSGNRIIDLSVESASRVQISGEGVRVAGEVTIRDVQFDTEIDALVEAESISIATGTDLVIRASIQANSGNIDLSSTTRTLVTDGATIQVAEAQIKIDGGDGEIDFGGGVLLSDSLVSPILVRQATNIVLGDVFAPNTAMRIDNVTGAVRQAAGTRLVLDRLIARNATQVDVSNDGNVLNLVDLQMVRRLNAIQTTGDIDLEIQANGPITVERFYTGDGNIVVHQIGLDQPLEILSMQTDNGSITVEAQGTITARSIIATGGDISVTAFGAKSDLLVTSIIATGGADVRLEAGDDILDTNFNDANRIEADDLHLVSHNGDASDTNGIRLNTNVNDLVAHVDGSNPGDLEITEVDRITLASSDAMANDSLSTTNGQIVIRAQEIVVIDTSVGDEDSDRKGDPEVIANGENGRIELTASDRLELSDNVQLHATKVALAAPIGQIAKTRPMPVNDGFTIADRAVVLTAPTVVLGENIEIFTGMNQGTARYFGPRPSVEIIPDLVKLLIADNRPLDANGEVIPTAFFDPTSIEVNILEQALVNDANGILTLDIGQAGERGLVVNIDWGASELPELRFQQLYNLSADQSIFFGVDVVGKPLEQQPLPDGTARLSVTHFYSQDDILNSVLNGRTAATAPLNVRFAVQQHPSILVVGTTIDQRGIQDSAPGAVLSTTNNPLTARDANPGLETGAAAFLIPSLSIPFAFVPIRDVIPEFETPEIVVRVTTETRLQSNNFETLAMTASSAATREEYFQLRILSADPGGEDLAEAQKLPADILDGDKLNRLFENLPDGIYEIQYVLGDGNERSILRVEVRNGAAKLSAGDLDEGVLRLKRLRDAEKSK